MVNITIIIPHHNSPLLLERCLCSIPDVDDIQVIVVDDNSAKDSKIKIQELSKVRKHTEFYYIDKNNTNGAGKARNEGLKHARGKWLVFSDADDFFTEDAFGIFHNYIDCFYDLIVFKHSAIVSATGEKTHRSEYRNEYITDYLNSPSKDKECMIRYNNDVPWAKMIRYSIVSENNLEFEEVPSSNDQMFSTYVGYYAKQLKVCSDVVYVATVREGSITTSKSEKRAFSDFCAGVRHNAFLKSKRLDNYQIRLISMFIYATRRFGLKESIKFFKYARSFKVNIFWGVGKSILSILSKFIKK